MADRIFLRLDDTHALGADELQWILFRAHTRKTGMTWDGISFVRSTKAILLRCIREKGCKPTVEAQLAIDGLPPTFDAWKALAQPPAQRKTPQPAIGVAMANLDALRERARKWHFQPGLPASDGASAIRVAEAAE